MRFQQLFLSCPEVKYPLKLHESQGKKLGLERLVEERKRYDKKTRRRQTREERRGCDTTVFIHVLRTVRRMSVHRNWVTAVVRDTRCLAKLGFHVLFRNLN